MLRQVLRFHDKFSPQIRFGRQQPRSQILLNVLPGRLCFRGCQALLKYRKAQRISEFNPMKLVKSMATGLACRHASALGELASVM